MHCRLLRVQQNKIERSAFGASLFFSLFFLQYPKLIDFIFFSIILQVWAQIPPASHFIFSF